MVNYETQLKSWGSTGTEYPDGYSYEEGEAPVDEWDNYFVHNVIEDINHLITETNEHLLRREGGELTGNLTVGSHRLVGDSGYVDFGGTELTVDATTNVLQSLLVGGDIDVNGTVDGVNVSQLEEDYDSTETTVNNHVLNENNPHNVTHTQVGAASELHGPEAHDGDLIHETSIESPSYPTLNDVPELPAGAIVYVEEEGEHYFEDGV